VETEKREIQQSAYTTLGDDDITSLSPSSSASAAAAAAAATVTAAAYVAADGSKSVSQTSVAADRALDEVVEVP